jgi:acetylornithine deacetylase/succinyl-diaminopimelate desuccinylase-like protein
MTSSVDRARDRIGTDMPRIQEELERLVRIPSVSAQGFDPGHVRASAQETAQLMEAAGLQGVRFLEFGETHPAVFGEVPGPPGAPTVLLYAHHDVQPPGDAALWDSPPFEPQVRDDRLYGRGSSDDKAGIVAHVSAIRAHDARPPVGVKVFIEGEEESGSQHLPGFLAEYGELLAADTLVLADASNWRLGIPGLTTSLRGIVDCLVEVRTLEHAVHSGMYGGPVPDAISAMAHLLSTLRDERGNVAIAGLDGDGEAQVDYDESDYRADVAAVEGLQLIGDGSISERLWTKPAVAVLGIDAPSVVQSSNQIVPVARAVVSLRIPPGVGSEKAMDALVSHLESNAPWGARVTVTAGAGGEPFALRADGPVYDAARRAFRDAWGADAIDIGSGGTIPFIKAFVDAFPEAVILLTGVEDPDGRAHGENESVHLGELERACVAETLLLDYLAEG